MTPTPRPERTIGPYVVQRALGQGAMGVVVEALDPRTGAKVAIKQALGLAAAPERLERFEREALLAGQLAHHGIARVHDIVTQGPDAPYIVMEHVDGTPLSTLCTRGPLDPNQAATFALQISRALEHAHGRGVVHRDIKPPNVMISESRGAVVLDFGLAKDMDARSQGLTKTGQLLGTLPFMAPEQIAHAKAALPASDLHAVGAVLYACLTGVPPFGDGPPLAVMDAIQSTQADPPSARRPDVPSSLDAICLKCLAKDPADRYPSATELAADLERFLSGAKVLARPPGSSASGPLKLAAALSLLVLLAAIAFAAFVRDAPSPRVAAPGPATPPPSSPTTTLPTQPVATPPAPTEQRTARELLAEAALPDSPQLARRYQQALEGDRYAIADLGRRYLNGDGVPQDPPLAVALLEDAIAHETTTAMNSLARGLLATDGPVERDPERGVALFERAAALGNPAAQMALALILRRGLHGVAKDPRRAVEIYRELESAGAGAGLFNLGQVFEHGEGVPRDPVEAARLFIRAANTNISEAPREMARLLRAERQEFHRDLPELQAWLHDAVRAGRQDAEVALVHLAAGTELAVFKTGSSYLRWGTPESELRRLHPDIALTVNQSRCLEVPYEPLTAYQFECAGEIKHLWGLWSHGAQRDLLSTTHDVIELTPDCLVERSERDGRVMTSVSFTRKRDRVNLPGYYMFVAEDPTGRLSNLAFAHVTPRPEVILRLDFEDDLLGRPGGGPLLVEGVERVTHGHRGSALKVGRGGRVEYRFGAFDPNEGSLTAWVRSDWAARRSGEHPSHALFGYQSAPWKEDLRLWVWSRRFLQLRSHQGGAVVTTGEYQAEWPADVWFMVAATWSASRGTLATYVNGVPVGSAASWKPLARDPTLPLRVGGLMPGSETAGWEGLIDELVLYDRALDASEVEGFYRGD